MFKCGRRRTAGFTHGRSATRCACRALGRSCRQSERETQRHATKQTNKQTNKQIVRLTAQLPLQHSTAQRTATDDGKKCQKGCSKAAEPSARDGAGSTAGWTAQGLRHIAAVTGPAVRTHTVPLSPAPRAAAPLRAPAQVLLDCVAREGSMCRVGCCADRYHAVRDTSAVRSGAAAEGSSRGQVKWVFCGGSERTYDRRVGGRADDLADARKDIVLLRIRLQETVPHALQHWTPTQVAAAAQTATAGSADGENVSGGGGGGEGGGGGR